MSEPRDSRERERERDSALNPGLLATAPALARLAAHAWWRTAEWTAASSLQTTGRVLNAARSGQNPAELLAQAGSEVRDYAQRLLGLADVIESAVARDSDEDAVTAAAQAVVGDDARRRARAEAEAETARADGSLRERGEELLRRSADVTYHEEAHPAYERILGELAPDDARILRFLYLEGPQPAVDVRTSKTLGVTSEMVAPGLSMIGEQAGARYLDRVPAYLNNLYRLGLIWFSHEPLSDPLRYQVLEAQPKVTEALSGSGRGKTVRRSIHLTPFGEDFCETCLPVDTGEFEAIVLDEDDEPRDDLPNVSRHPV